jgi:hypothetical protein
MSAYWKFDPYKDREPETPAKVAKVAKEGTGKTITLAGLATLAAPPAENANSSFRCVAFKGEADEGHRTLAAVPSLTDIPTDLVLGLRAVAETPCPIMIEPKRWLQLRQDAQRFVDQWGPQAAGRRHTSSAAIRRIRRIVTTICAWSGWLRVQKSSSSAPGWLTFVTLLARFKECGNARSTSAVSCHGIFEDQKRQAIHMKSRIRGGDAARAAVATTGRLPVPLQATDLVGPFQPVGTENLIRVDGAMESPKLVE